MKHIISIVLSAAFLLFARPSGAETLPYGTIQKAAAAIGDCLKDKGEAKVAVTGIRSMEGGENGLVLWLTESLTSELAANPALHVLERNRLEEVIAENKTSFSDLFDPDQAKAMGGFLSADVLVSGTLVRAGKDFDLNLRVTDCEKGVVVAGCGFHGALKASAALTELYRKQGGLTVSVFPETAQATVHMDGRMMGITGDGRNVIVDLEVKPGQHRLRVTAPGFPAQEQTIQVRPMEPLAVRVRLEKPLKVKFWQEDVESGAVVGNKGSIFTGRTYRFCFSASRDCYIYVFNKGTSGRIFPLVPNDKLLQGNHIAGDENKISRIPETGGFPIEGEAGIEKIFVIASVSPIRDLDRAAAGLLEGAKGIQAAFQTSVQEVREKSLTKDYGLPRDQPAVAESVSLNPADGLVMELTYRHE